MKKNIGSEFKLSLRCFFRRDNKEFKKIIPENKEKIFLSSGRDSIIYLINNLNIKKVLLPSYICKNMINPFRRNDVKVIFYKLKNNLEVDLKDIEKRIRNEDIKFLFIIHYFGFPQPVKEIIKICKKYNILLVEDCAQSFLSKYMNKPLGSLGFASFNSYRKLIPIPDGSLLTINKKIKTDSEIFYSNTLFICSRILLLTIRDLLSMNSYKKMYNKLETLPYKKPSRMSRISRTILSRTGIEDIVKKRRKNYAYILKNIHKGIKPLFPNISKDICPLGFPIITNNRNKVRDYLIKNNIFPPIHWNLPSEIDKDEFKNSWFISNNILTIPIDQRYNQNDMKYIINVIKNVPS